MRCLNCDHSVYIEDFEDSTPFLCEYCGVWLQVDQDEGTYLGAIHTTLRIIDEKDLP